LRQSTNYGSLHETHRESLPRTRSGVDDLHSRLEPQARPPRNYEALRDTQHQVDHQSPRTRSGVDRDAAQQGPERPEIQRSWTHHGGMVPQQHSANIWDRQNQEIIRMSDNQRSGAGREGEGQPARDENDPELQEARAAVEEARQREAAERARMQERDRGGPER
jgi:hypothetical protein